MKEPWILGVSYSHNGAACLLRGEEIVVAIQEERLSGHKRARIENYKRSLAVRYCLDYAKIELRDLAQLVACSFAADPQGPASHPGSERVTTISHHLGHAYGVFATSGYDEAVVLVVDGQGSRLEHLAPAERSKLVRSVVPGQRAESEVVTIYRADSTMTLLEKQIGDCIPDMQQLESRNPGRSLYQFGSLGGMYSAVAALIFGDPMEAGKVMGLAPYGQPTWPIDAFFSIGADGVFTYSDRLPQELRELEQWPQNRKRHEDLACSVQQALEYALLFLARRARELSQASKLCFAGGVALNSVANERLCRTLGFEDVYVMPAAEDSGTAIGAAYYGLGQVRGKIAGRRLPSDSVGRKYRNDEIDDAIGRALRVEVVHSDDVLETTVSALCDGQIIGWFEGGSELGPRSLGQRSILCDPRRPDAKATLNERVKHREGFRPFAPVILREDIETWFDVAPGWGDSPYMLRVWSFLEAAKAKVPAVVHVDGTGRVQTLTRDVNGRLYQLLEQFRARTGVPLLLNTSFNVAGEPIIETPDDALWCMLTTGVDAVVLEGKFVRKNPNHRSLLDVYPRVRAKRATVEVPIENGRLDLSAGASSRVLVVADTMHGESTSHVRTRDLPLLRLCDGRRNGWAILKALQAAGDHVDESNVVRRLHCLRRAHVLSLHETEA